MGVMRLQQYYFGLPIRTKPKADLDDSLEAGVPIANSAGQNPNSLRSRLGQTDARKIGIYAASSGGRGRNR
jgi:hypothetical protein